VIPTERVKIDCGVLFVFVFGDAIVRTERLRCLVAHPSESRLKALEKIDASRQAGTELFPLCGIMRFLNW
jgi:hypothetical protein